MYSAKCFLSWRIVIATVWFGRAKLYLFIVRLTSPEHGVAVRLARPSNSPCYPPITQPSITPPNECLHLPIDLLSGVLLIMKHHVRGEGQKGRGQGWRACPSNHVSTPAPQPRNATMNFTREACHSPKLRPLLYAGHIPVQSGVLADPVTAAECFFGLENF